MSFLGKMQIVNGADSLKFFYQMFDCFRKGAGSSFNIDGFHQNRPDVQTTDGILQLTVQHHTVGDHNNGVNKPVLPHHEHA